MQGHVYPLFEKVKDHENSSVPFNWADLILLSHKRHMKCFYPYSGLNQKLFSLHCTFSRVSEDLMDQTTAFYQMTFSAFDLPVDKSLQHSLQEKWKLIVPPIAFSQPPFPSSEKQCHLDWWKYHLILHLSKVCTSCPFLKQILLI